MKSIVILHEDGPRDARVADGSVKGIARKLATQLRDHRTYPHHRVATAHSDFVGGVEVNVSEEFGPGHMDGLDVWHTWYMVLPLTDDGVRFAFKELTGDDLDVVPQDEAGIATLLADASVETSEDADAIPVSLHRGK